MRSSMHQMAHRTRRDRGLALEPHDDPANPNIVKVVTRANGRTMYFSEGADPVPTRIKH